MVNGESGNSQASVGKGDNNGKISDQLRDAREILEGVSESLRQSNRATTELEYITDQLPESIANLRDRVADFTEQVREKDTANEQEYERTEPEHGGLDRPSERVETINQPDRENQFSTQQGIDSDQRDSSYSPNNVDVEVDYGR